MDQKLINRLSRLEGQLKKLHQNIEEDKDCSSVIVQFMAVKGALAGAYEEYVKLSLDSCARNDKEKMQKLISLLVRN
ncbi:metal-sensitive transcriptional regulator [Candidatus Kaiserbacteria bacterium]|nr:metal-sensitive transcriptional regulator [Candidatus Kaiserbacteria bacterium]